MDIFKKLENVNPNWHSLSIISLLVLGILMLFFKELPDLIRERMIPALIIYILGTGLIGYFQGACNRSKFYEKGKEPLWIYFVLHFVWFVMFVGYLIMWSIF